MSPAARFPLTMNKEVPVPLRLRLTHGFGDARSGSLSISADGTGMAGALELGGDRLNDVRWRAANLCRIAWQSEGKGWQLWNGSHTLTCALNGKRLVPETSLSIAAGDLIELGLLRFVVEWDDVVEDNHPSSIQHARPEPPIEPVGAFSIGEEATSARHNDEGAAFDLRDLASPGDGVQPLHLLDDPFGVLDIAGAEARSAVDPLAELLGKASSSSEARHSSSSNALRTTANLVKSAASTDALTNTDPDARAVSDLKPDSVKSLLDGLHDEFARVVRDPNQLAGRTDWEGVLAKGSEPAPTLEDLSRQAKAYPLLRDIVLPQEGIDQVVDHFDPLGQSGFLDVDEPDDVLRLFAPELTRSTTAPVPTLTRREHHDLSPDSHMRIGRPHPNDEEAS